MVAKVVKIVRLVAIPLAKDTLNGKMVLILKIKNVENP